MNKLHEAVDDAIARRRFKEELANARPGGIVRVPKGIDPVEFLDAPNEPIEIALLREAVAELRLIRQMLEDERN